MYYKMNFYSFYNVYAGLLPYINYVIYTISSDPLPFITYFDM